METANGRVRPAGAWVSSRGVQALWGFAILPDGAVLFRLM